MALRSIVLLISVSLGSWAGWLIGSFGGLFSAYFISVVGATIGLVIGRKLQRNLDGD
jgi:hypothetical protein